MTAPAAGRRLRALVPAALVSVVGSLLLAAPTASASGIAPSTVVPAQHQQQQQQDDKTMPIVERINRAANIAISHIGDPYVYGAAGPHRFDCSGLTMWSYGHSALSLPRTSASQYASVRHILKVNMMRGDLVFFHHYGHVYHVGIFLYWNADHRAVIIHAPYPGQKVHRAPVWTSSWYAGTRRP